MNKEIIFICQVFWPDQTATSQLFTGLFTQLANQTPITVLTGYPTRKSSSDQDDLNAKTYKGVHIQRCGFNLDSKKNFLLRALVYISFLIHVAAKLMKVNKNQLVLGVSNPPFLVIVLFLVSRIKKFPYQYFLADIYPEGLIALGKLNRKAFIARIWKFANLYSYRGANALFVLGRDMAELLSSEYQIDISRFIYIPHWSATEVDAPIPINKTKLAKRLNITDKFIFQYSGNMGLWHDMDTIVAAANKLKQYEDIHFLFIGTGIRRKNAELVAQALNTTNITWLDPVPLADLHDSLSCCNVALVSLREGLEGVAVPSKIYGILAVGRAVVAQVPSCSEIGLVVQEENCGYVVAPGNSAELAAAMLKLARSKHEVDEMGKKAFRAYKDKYTLAQAITSFEQLWHLN